MSARGPHPLKLGNVASMVRVLRQMDQPALTRGGPSPARVPSPESALRKRQMLADLCRLIAAQVGAGAPARGLSADPLLSPRHQQTLEHLLGGDSEKEVAARLKLSPNTVHVYVKALYRHFSVSSRGELLAHFVRRSHIGPALFSPIEPQGPVPDSPERSRK